MFYLNLVPLALDMENTEMTCAWSQTANKNESQIRQQHVIVKHQITTWTMLDFDRKSSLVRLRSAYPAIPEVLELWKPFQSLSNMVHVVIWCLTLCVFLTSWIKFGRGDQGTIPRPWSDNTLMFGVLFLTSKHLHFIPLTQCRQLKASIYLQLKCTIIHRTNANTQHGHDANQSRSEIQCTRTWSREEVDYPGAHRVHSKKEWWDKT